MFRIKALSQVPRRTTYEKKYPEKMDYNEQFTLAKRMETNEFSDDPDSDNYWFIWFEGDPPVDTGDTITYFGKAYTVASFKWRAFGRQDTSCKGLLELEL